MKTTKKNAKTHLDEIATRLAGELGIETLEVRNRDRLDFHDVHVAGLRRILQRAFVLGMQATEAEGEDIQRYIDAL